ncbi:3-dehydroquinate synthase [Virgibacillus proomii]|uniref:3-dehydroquinate synthase n=1 Tax=Virgibacillus proomii TaxID=84407 RepID=UPI001C106D8A|nr:3-dehydroquinate synthase [Virgibacillus proomii]MBU5265419.1 3-dehydroquinate synthase [Virgibacillus proomii]
MKTTELIVQASTHSYTITIGEGIRNQIANYLPKEYSAIWIVTDERVRDLYLSDCLSSLSDHQVHHTVVPRGERTKSIEYFYQLQTEAIKFGLDRDALLIALGGGVIGDLAGFVAATYMRGIDYIQIPTTILAHDSSVGGKVAINHSMGKNLIGSFYQPQAVIYDVETLQSLSEQEVRSGYAELIKEAMISDELTFHSFLKADLAVLSLQSLQTHLRTGIQIKAEVVEKDEKEAGIRKYLNLGHTLGHALEAELGYGSLTHGEAVAIGLLFAVHVSEQFFDNELPFRQLKQWMEQNQYPLHIKAIEHRALLAKMKKDKKNKQKQIQMVLLEKIGKPVIRTIGDQAMLDYLHSFERKLVKK